MRATRGARALGAALGVALVVLIAVAAASAAGEKYAVYGADLTPAQRQELEQLFGSGVVKAETLTTQEMVAALQGTGLPVAPGDDSISSSVLTCLDEGAGLTVSTKNITRIPATLYANALVVAGVRNGVVLIAAPADNPVTGEAALAGVLKAFPQCQGAGQVDPGRARLAYELIAATAALGGATGDLTKAAEVMLQATQAVITGQARDDQAIAAAFQSAAAAQGFPLTEAQRADYVALLKRLRGPDYGAYARGFQIQRASPNEAKVVPTGGPAPAASPGAGAGPAGGPSPAASPALGAAPAGGACGAGGASFSGEVANAGQPLTVRVDGRDRAVTPCPDAVVTRDGQPAALADIRPEDRARVTTAPDGRATRIEATSDDGPPGWLAWLLPLLALLALLGLLLWFLLGRRRDSFILERVRRR